jgi:hypothetical protein
MPANYSAGIFEQCRGDSGEMNLPWRACDILCPAGVFQAKIILDCAERVYVGMTSPRTWCEGREAIETKRGCDLRSEVIASRLSTKKTWKFARTVKLAFYGGG